MSSSIVPSYTVPFGVSGRRPVATGHTETLEAAIEVVPDLGIDRPVAWFRGTLDAAGARTVAKVVDHAVETGVPVVGVVEQMGMGGDLDLLGAVGQASAALARASGVVPTALVLDGPCLGGPALTVGLVDIVTMTKRAELFVNAPEASHRTTGTGTATTDGFGGPWSHLSVSGVATSGADSVTDALAYVGDVLSFLPEHNQAPPPVLPSLDPADRPSAKAAQLVPESARASYDVRDVIRDLIDDADFVELQPNFGGSICVGLGRLAGQPVGIVGNQPSQLAGALDIDSSLKGARFVRWCDAFNLPLLTLVDTPGFRPGRDQEWQGIVRHGAKLAYAYAEATVPRASVVLRKAYGGAYIVMDCKSMGSDCTLAWPRSEIAVMGAQGAVEILHRRELGALDDPTARREQLEADYSVEHLSPRAALERGFVDEVIEPSDTRAVLAAAFAALVGKHRTRPDRRHDNIPL